MDEQKDKEKTFTAGWWSYSIFQHGLMRSCWQAKLWPVGQAIGVYHETNCFLLSVVLSCIAKTYHHKSKKGHMLCKRLGDLHVIKKKVCSLTWGNREKHANLLDSEVHLWSLKNALRRQIREPTGDRVERSTSLSGCHFVCLCALTHLYSIFFLRLDLAYLFTIMPIGLLACLPAFLVSIRPVLLATSTYALSWLCQRHCLPLMTPYCTTDRFLSPKE